MLGVLKRHAMAWLKVVEAFCVCSVYMVECVTQGLSHVSLRTSLFETKALSEGGVGEGGVGEGGGGEGGGGEGGRA